jgi:hypothetical protein
MKFNLSIKLFNYLKIMNLVGKLFSYLSKFFNSLSKFFLLFEHYFLRSKNLHNRKTIKKTIKIFILFFSFYIVGNLPLRYFNDFNYVYYFISTLCIVCLFLFFKKKN